MIKFQDSTIRDGMQQRNIHKNFSTQLEVLNLIGKTGIDSVEIGMCAAAEDLFLIKKKIEYLNKNQNAVVLTRLIEEDILLTSQLKATFDNLVIKLLVPVSDLHLTKKLGITKETLCLSLNKCLKLMESLGINTDVCLEDATRGDKEFLFEILNICGKYKIGFVTIADTVGFCTPEEYGKLIKEIVNLNHSFKVSVHCHNDLGLATANTIAGILSGATQVEGTFLGIGERAGNTAIDEVCYIMRHKYNFDTALELNNIYKTSKKIEEIIHYKSSPLKPILGENAFVHESGIHQNGMLKDKNMYQFVSPEEVGLKLDIFDNPVSGISSSKVISNYINSQFGEIQNSKDIVKFYKSLAKIMQNITVDEAYYLYCLNQGQEDKTIEVLNEKNMNLNKVIEHMEEGNPIIIPTDTNYNLACFPDSKEAIDKIFMYKKRPKNKALSLFFLEPQDWKNYGITDNRELMQIIIDKFWPGALNIVVNKKTPEYDYMLNGYDTISLGCISNPTWRYFMKKLDGKPIAITSANISGTVDDMLVTKEIAVEQMGNSVKYFIESQHPIQNSKSSTIISIEPDGVKMLREGDITLDVLDMFLREEGYRAYK